jgi:putative phosphonate metabolism protein
MSMSEENGKAPRYGIYFAPGAGSRLHELGSQWLGRDAVTGEPLDPCLPGDMARDEWLRATESPRRYGFHATLKPPFRPADGVDFEDLRTALREFAAIHEGFEAPALAVNILGRFVALTLSEQSEELSRLADDCVRAFERFRAPATERELALRLKDSLSAREREHVMQWGYPYLFDTWKFHMSLTGSLPGETLPPLADYLRGRFAPAGNERLLVDSVCIFLEPFPGAPFRVVERAQLRSL